MAKSSSSKKPSASPVASSSSSPRQHAPSLSDPRFHRLQTDPRFLAPQKEASKVVVDDRFRGLLDGGNFGINQGGKKQKKIDRFGRKGGKGSKEEEDMKRLYKLEEKMTTQQQQAGVSGDRDEEDQEDVGESSDDEGGEGREEAGKGFVDYARGAADLESSSDESDEDEDDGDDDDTSDGDSDDVAIGSSTLLRKDRRRRAARGSSMSDSDSEEDQEEHEEGLASVDPKILAQLDAEAAAMIRQGGAEDSSDEDSATAARASSSRTSAKVRRKGKEERIPMGGETRRLAIVNLDWDHVRSLDLYKVFSSLVSPLATRLPGTSSTLEGEKDPSRPRRNVSLQVKGTVELVRVYPSEFGRDRMKREDIEGPPKDIFKSSSNDATGSSSKRKTKRSSKSKGKRRDADEDSDESDIVFEVDDGGEFDEEALRKYQLDRLRYYYAVATFDSPAAARHIYDEIDGTEMERTANVFDLRFVPDDTDFPLHSIAEGDDGWRDEAKPGIDDNVTYTGVDWATDALRHSKVRLTWDAPDPERQKIIKRAMTKDDLRDDDLRAYLASDTDDDDDIKVDAGSHVKGKGGAERDRFRALLGVDENVGASSAFSKKNHASAFQDGRGSDDEAGGQGDMEITFLPGLSEAAARRANGSKDKEEGEETTLEKYLRKQREKKDRRKAARETDGDDEAGAAAAAVATAGKVKEGDLGFDDPFFASGGEEERDVDVVEARERKQSKSDASVTIDGKKSTKLTAGQHGRDTTATAGADELALLVDGESAVGGRSHFDMKDILKSESKSGKKLNRWERKKAKKAGLTEVVSAPIGTGAGAHQDFKLDINDGRFGDLMSNHEYALDPTHPSFMQTTNMKMLMEERRRRSAAEAGEDGGRKKRKADIGAESTGVSGSEASELLRDLKRRQGGQLAKGRKALNNGDAFKAS